MSFDPLAYPTAKAKMEKTMSKIDAVATLLANHKDGDLMCADGLYYILEDAMDELREIMLDVEQERECYAHNLVYAKKAA